MTVQLSKPPRGSVPVHATDRSHFAAHTQALEPAARRWLQSLGFTGAPDTHALLPGADGRVSAVWVGVHGADHPWALAAFPKALPEGAYHLAAPGEGGLKLDTAAAAMSWELGAYTFDLYKTPRRAPAQLFVASTAAAQKALIIAAAMASTRDLVNTPAEAMGPSALAEAVKLVAKQHGATFKQTVGDKLLGAGFPAIHAVGRAADAASGREPRLIELNWGKPKHPRISIVGKGVCFDSGGLDIKGADGMRLMKKDMGGAANALGLAQMIMALNLRVRLQLLIPAVENAIAGNAFRPGDVFKTRKGLHIEIGNTDAEGRVILCDALAYAAEGKPELIVDMATLTGAARVALGAQLPALFCRDMDLARELVDRSLALHDPLWHMPLWRPYHGSIESDIADIVNTGKTGLAGAVTAALFLDDFVPEDIAWLHLDLFAWNNETRPGRPVGGEAQTVRTLLGYLESRYATAASTGASTAGS
jgi:leucyl aminopeptidase